MIIMLWSNLCPFPLGNKSERRLEMLNQTPISAFFRKKERTLTELNVIETELTTVLGHNISFEVEKPDSGKDRQRCHAERIQTDNWGAVCAAGLHRDR